MKNETRQIWELLGAYLTENPEIRFTQALFNLDINRFADSINPHKKDYHFKDNYSELDPDVLERVKKEYYEYK